MYTVYSQKKPRVDEGEKFLKPSLTDQLADEPLDRLVQRYMISGGKLSFGASDIDTDEKSTEEDVEAAFEDLATEDVAGLDRVERAQILEEAREASALLNELALRKKGQGKSTGALDDKAATTDAPKDEKSEK